MFEITARFADRDHMGVADRQKFASRLLTAIHLVANEVADSDLDTLDTFRNAVQVNTRAETNQDHEGPVLQNCLTNIAKSLPTQPAYNALSEDEKARADKLITALKQTDCKACGATRGKGPDSYCTGYPAEDNSIIAAEGQCVSAIMKLAELIIQLTHDTYEKLLSTINYHFDCTQVEIEIIVAPSKGRRSTAVLGDYQQGGESHIRQAVLTLSIDPEAEDKEIYEVPYLLAHEIMVHGVQSIAGGAVTEEVPESCCFTEGMVDRAAFEVIRDAFNGTQLFANDEFSAASQPMSSKTSTRHEDRINIETYTGTPRPVRQQDHRNYGALVRTAQLGRRVFTALDQQGIPKKFGFTKAWELVLLLNIAKMTSEERKPLFFHINGLIGGEYPLIFDGQAEKISENKDIAYIKRVLYSFHRDEGSSFELTFSDHTPGIIPPNRNK